MANRELPNVYVSVNDLSALIEGDDSLIVGITLRANRGPLYEACKVENSSDFLTKFTFTGKPGAKQDTTYFDILELLKVSENVYVSRAANNPLYGGLLFKKEQSVGDLVGITAGNLKRILVKGNVADKVKKGDTIRITGEALEEGNYGKFVVASAEYVTPYTQIELTEPLAKAIQPTPIEEDSNEDIIVGNVTLCKLPIPLNQIKIATVETANTEANTLVFDGNVAKFFTAGDRNRIGDEFFTVEEAVYDQAETKTAVKVKETVTEGLAGKDVVRHSISDPNTFIFEKDDLFLITGIDQGEYNSKIGIEIVSGLEEELDAENAFKVIVHNLETHTDVEEYLVSMSLTQKTIDGVNIHVADVINGMSDYIKVWTPDNENIIEDTIPSSTSTYIALGGGYDGGEVSIADNIEALQVFADKTVPVSLLVNGNNANVLYQSAMIAICESRMDCFSFLRAPKMYENLKLPAQRIKSLVSYKKDTLASTSYMAAIYGPTITVTDNYNARKVGVGAEAIACKQWLKTIRDDGYPYAAAGITNGRLDNVTIDWKIGDESSEAKAINNASMNVAVYEARQKYYYFNTQNTLQLANSAFRNTGCVLNILNIKEVLQTRLKDYVQLPISNNLRESVEKTIVQVMEGCLSNGRVMNYHLNDNTTANDISNNELHYLLTLVPAYYAQTIYLVMNVVNAAFDFKILQNN